MLVALEQDLTVGTGHRDDTTGEAALGERDRSATLALHRERVDVGAVEPLERGDEVGRDALGHGRERGPEVGVAAVDGDGAGGEVPPRHRLDPAGDDEVLVPARHAHGRHRDRLLRGSAEAVERHARHGLRPTRQQGRQATDRVVVTGEDAVAGDHVVDLGGIEPDPRRQRPETLGEQLLGMDVVQRAVGASLAAGRADHVDDPGVGHRLAHLSEPGAGRASARSSRTSGPTSSGDSTGSVEGPRCQPSAMASTSPRPR